MSDNHQPTRRTRLLPGVRYAIAILLTLAGPAVVGASLILALLIGEAGLIGLGLIGGAILGASGAVAMLWCLQKPA